MPIDNIKSFNYDQWPGSRRDFLILLWRILSTATLSDIVGPRFTEAQEDYPQDPDRENILLKMKIDRYSLQTPDSVPNLKDSFREQCHSSATLWDFENPNLYRHVQCLEVAFMAFLSHSYDNNIDITFVLKDKVTGDYIRKKMSDYDYFEQLLYDFATTMSSSDVLAAVENWPDIFEKADVNDLKGAVVCYKYHYGSAQGFHSFFVLSTNKDTGTIFFVEGYQYNSDLRVLYGGEPHREINFENEEYAETIRKNLRNSYDFSDWQDGRPVSWPPSFEELQAIYPGGFGIKPKKQEMSLRVLQEWIETGRYKAYRFKHF